MKLLGNFPFTYTCTENRNDLSRALWMVRTCDLIIEKRVGKTGVLHKAESLLCLLFLFECLSTLLSKVGR